ncbi:MAG TPA: hypothetical protein VJU77_16000 [Chthoniobacterales bacterium]|nr:hypothetical protein [Chthoniobacterales bacterium]
MPAAPSEDITREGLFASTRWTIIRKAAQSQTPTIDSQNALSELCGIYWQPVYLFLRRQGKPAHDAQDLTQGFFADLIENRAYARAERSKGRFRSFLLGALKHFLADEHDRDRAQKRGGGAILRELDDVAISEAEVHAARANNGSADHVYDREWASSLLRQSLSRLAQECAVAGKGALFQALKSQLSVGAETQIPYDEIAPHLGRPVVTLRSDVGRLRARFRAILREEVGGTLTNSAEVDEELRYLCQVMTG